MENYLANEWDRSHALKRGGGVETLSLNAGAAEAELALTDSGSASPEAVFERQWVFTLLGLVLERLRDECEATGKANLFEELRPHLLGDEQGRSYSEIAAQRGMSEGAVKVAAHRLRQRYGEMLREEIARTVSREEEVDAEIRQLLNVVAG
jgi:RNA polymerase sigma-70 factor (ECF subfamily)